MGGLISVHEPVYLLMVAVLAIVALLVLIIKLKVHSFVSLILVSLGSVIATGVTFEQVLPTMMRGFAGTLASVALLVALGAMIGRMLQVSSGAR